MQEIDRLASANGLSRKSAKGKVLFGAFLLALSLLIGKSSFHIGIFSLVLIIVKFFGKIHLRDFLKLYSFPLAFLLMGVFAIALSISQNPDGYVRFLRLGSWVFGFSKDSISSAILVFTRSLAAISSTFFIMATTPLHQIIRLLNDLHLNSDIVDLMVLIYRFILVFSMDLSDMHMAMSLKFGYGTIYKWIRSEAYIGSQLFGKMMDSYKSWLGLMDLKVFEGKFF